MPLPGNASERWQRAQRIDCPSVVAVSNRPAALYPAVASASWNGACPPSRSSCRRRMLSRMSRSGSGSLTHPPRGCACPLELEAWQVLQSVSSETGSTTSVVASTCPEVSRATRRMSG